MNPAIRHAATAASSCAAALAVMAMAGCFGHDPAERQWREIRTARFILVTDLDRDDAREHALELDERGAALTHLYRLLAPSQTAVVRPVQVVHLASCDELSRLRGTPIFGVVGPSIQFEIDRLIFTCQRSDQRSETAVHELTHDLNHRYFADLPVWLEEGLATYYQTLETEGGRAVVGRPLRLDAHFWRATMGLPPMGELLAMGDERFYAMEARRGYFAAWKLTHMLANGSRDNHGRFRRMLAGLASGHTKHEAFAGAFGDIADRLGREYKRYHLTRQLNVWQLPYRKAAGGIVGERILRRGEAHALWIELGFFRDDPDREAILERVDRLDREDPEWSRRLYWRALVHLALKISREPPIDLFRRYVAREPDDGSGWLGLVRLELDRRIPAGHLGTEPAPPPGLDQIEDQVRALLRVATTPAQLNAVGWYYALRRRPQIGMNFTLRALAAEPGCASCWDTLALLYHHAGRAAEALAAQERAVALMTESDTGVPAAYQTRLQQYRRLSKEARTRGAR